MATPFAKGFSTAYKRARSQDSPTALASPPVLKATKLEEEAPQDDAEIPAFLRQSPASIRTKFNDLVWKEKLRLLQGRNDPTSTWVQEVNPQVTKQNRYANVQPWEKSRIHLKVAEGKSDYINASPISLRDPRSGVETRYIATQGPKQSGISHFWQMVWQETNDVAVIVMLTQTHEGPMEKCSQYFPPNAEAGSYKVEPIDQAEGTPEGSVTFSDITSDPGSKTEIRKLSLKFGEEIKDVWHFMFSGWSDFAVPEDQDRPALLRLLKLSAQKNNTPSNPRIIHCSAGVGRSGTFIALEYLLAQVEIGAIADVKDGGDIVYDVVNRLREQRMLMVQMDAQFHFLYDMVTEQYKQKQAALRSSGQHSPKIQKLSSGLRAALIDDASAEHGFFHKGVAEEGHDDDAERIKTPKGQAVGPGKAGITRILGFFEQAITIVLGSMIAFAAGVVGVYVWAVSS